MIKSMISFQIFEFVTVIFETFIVHQYISGLFEKRSERKNALFWYVIFCAGLTILSLFYNKEITLIGYTLIGVYVLAVGIYKTSITSRIFAVFYFAAIMMGAEIFTSGLISGFWNIDLSNVFEYGLPRVLCILVAKLIQIFFVKLSVFITSWKNNLSLKSDPKLMLPLLLCQVFSIILAYYVFIICIDVYNEFPPIALLAMIGILYMNTVVFWYFDRVKMAFEYKSRNEIAEYKMKLQKEYFEILNKHQQETDALWHDMKKHLSVMKTLINNGHQDITAGYIFELETQMNETIKIIRTDYPVLSAVLTEQMQRTKKAGIHFDIDVRLNSNMKIDPVDLCVILGNLFDNAFEACELLMPEVEKNIKAIIIQRNNVLIITIENTYVPISTTRRRFGKHGFGQKNIRHAIAKYNGEIEIIEKNGIYKVTITVI